MLTNAEHCLETLNNVLKSHRITLMLKIFEMTRTSGKPVPRAAAAYGRQLKTFFCELEEVPSKKALDF